MVIFDEIKVVPFVQTDVFRNISSSKQQDVIDSKEEAVDNFYKIPYSKKNVKTFTVNFSTNSDAKILEKMNGIQSHTGKGYPIILKYRFETYTGINSDIQEFEGSLYLNPAEGMVLHYYPDVFDQNATNAILRLVILFMKKKNLENKMFKVYNEHSANVSYIRVNETEDSDVSEKFIENSVANINRQVRNVLTPRGFLLASSNDTLFTNEQRKAVNNVLFKGVNISPSAADSGDILITNNRNLGVANGPFFTPFFEDNDSGVRVVRANSPLFRRRRPIDDAIEEAVGFRVLKDVLDTNNKVVRTIQPAFPPPFGFVERFGVIPNDRVMSRGPPPAPLFEPFPPGPPPPPPPFGPFPLRPPSPPPFERISPGPQLPGPPPVMDLFI